MSKRGRPPKLGGVVYKRDNSELWQVRYKDKKGEIIRESAGTSNRDEAERFLRDRLDARDEGRLSTVLTSKQLTFNQWADWFLEKRSKPPFRSPGNHEQNLNALKFLRPAFGELALSDITSEAVEDYLGDRLRSGRRIHTKLGLQLRGRIKPATAHQEFRILGHILNVAVRQKRLATNPCVSVEFPVSVKKSTRKPHYMTATEQEKIEVAAPGYLRNIVVIVSELGLRYKKELLPMKKEQVDLDNGLVHIADSKTVNGIGDMPLTNAAREAFRRQMEETPGSEYLFPSPRSGTEKPYMTNLRKVWAGTLKRAGVRYFAPYELRHTFATRLSAGGVADHMVTQMLRQGDAEVFKLYSQAKLGMMREALTRMDRQANERGISSTQRES
ncbi:MAG TPA: tyrosine-type recombinase/integrase [Bryobacteraceae bacterium]|nr:tyrosine-type recombinase/integrase [Bryobacteraceae bacterium]